VGVSMNLRNLPVPFMSLYQQSFATFSGVDRKVVMIMLLQYAGLLTHEIFRRRTAGILSIGDSYVMLLSPPEAVIFCCVPLHLENSAGSFCLCVAGTCHSSSSMSSF
jgi:hypothetical protein